MGETLENKPMKYKGYISIGLLAHVDAGKTTLAENLLYLCGAIREMGRVDHGNAYLDTDAQEKARGITIFSKQALLELGDFHVTLLDTPGHVDFSAEMERTLQILDYAILVISGTDGVQGHTLTLWKLLKRHRIPVFLFINKMDLAEGRKEVLMEQLKKELDDRCVDFTDTRNEEFLENAAVCEESVMEYYLSEGTVEAYQIQSLIKERKIFPCFFGSALKNTGIAEFVTGMSEYMQMPEYGKAFGAKIYKISRDEQGSRLTHMKITGGSLKVREQLSGSAFSAADGQAEQETWREKVHQIRLYSGAGYTPTAEALPGQVVAVTGLSQTYSGQGLGIETGSRQPFLEPVLHYRIRLLPEYDVYQSFLKLKVLEEEDPTLHILWLEEKGEIHIQLMGEVQTEVLKNLIRERFGMQVDFGAGSIIYKERIATVAEGIGHFEPLRHYAEVHLLLEPGEPGSGMTYETRCSEDELARSWQRLVMTHLEERVHKGVLTGAELTDTRITLTAGRAHVKHTEGGDFRQATYRAVRHGLMQAKSELLEPFYSFRLEVPVENIGRAMQDIQRKSGRFEAPDTQGETAVLLGEAPVATMQGYQTEVTAYTKGRGKLFCTLKGYEPCHNTEEVIQEIGYDPQADTEHTADSVFCAHGAGFVVPWELVREYAHIESPVWPGMPGGGHTGKEGPDPILLGQDTTGYAPRQRRQESAEDFIAQEEIDAIMQRTFGSNERKKKGWEGRKRREKEPYIGQETTYKPKYDPEAEEYLLVDGYNIIFAWPELKELAQVNIDAARDKLMDILCNYQGYKKCHVILVFDAYRVANHAETVMAYHNIHVVYTKEAETADSYIARTAASMEGKYKVTVATSDGLVQMIIWGKGAVRMSAQGLLAEVEKTADSFAAWKEGRSEKLGNTVL